jgi:DNA-binding beta-propeller fold protein YncE
MSMPTTIEATVRISAGVRVSAGTRVSTPPVPRPVLTERWHVDGGIFLGPSCVTPLDDGLMLVVDECQHTIALIDEAGAVVRRIGGEGSEPGMFRYPTHAAADGAGGFWVTDRWNHRVQHLDAAGNVIGVVGRYGPEPGEFNEPWGLAVRDHGAGLVVADRSNHRLQLIDEGQAVLDTFGRGGYDRGYYEGSGFKRGVVFQRWSELSNRFVSHETLFREQGYALGSLEYPQGVATTDDGRVLVADPGVGAILACRPRDGTIEPLVAPHAVRFVPTNLAGIGDGLFIAVADLGHTAVLFDGHGAFAFFNLPGIEHVTACARGSGSTLWCLDGWRHRLVCYDLAFEPTEDTAP